MATSKPAIEVTTGFGLGLSGIGCANFKLSQPRGSPPQECAQLCAQWRFVAACFGRNCEREKPHGYSFIQIVTKSAKLLIVRAATATNQKVGSSNLSGRAILFPKYDFRG